MSKNNKKKKKLSQNIKQLDAPDPTAQAVLTDDILHGACISFNKRNTKLNPYGVRLIETRDYAVDALMSYLCAWYVFSKTLEETWFEDLRQRMCIDDNAGRPLFVDTKRYLKKKKFKVAATLEEWDVVAYISRDKAKLAEYGVQAPINKMTTHFGLYSGDNQVISKYGSGDVYLHPINLLPERYGSEFMIFRKEYKLN